jgi:hypothetical protein
MADRSADYRAARRSGRIDGIESREYFLQLNQAAPAHRRLHAIAAANDSKPMGRRATSTAGMKKKPTTSKATLTV